MQCDPGRQVPVAARVGRYPVERGERVRPTLAVQQRQRHPVVSGRPLPGVAEPVQDLGRLPDQQQAFLAFLVGPGQQHAEPPGDRLGGHLLARLPVQLHRRPIQLDRTIDVVLVATLRRAQRQPVRGRAGGQLGGAEPVVEGDQRRPEGGPVVPTPALLREVQQIVRAGVDRQGHGLWFSPAASHSPGPVG
ncbi:hypothetical protein ONO86_01192 [Micromonospora noduli]|nr:hypothetical protein ONO86_01192 [Micromonospora noduli]